MVQAKVFWSLAGVRHLGDGVRPLVMASLLFGAGLVGANAVFAADIFGEPVPVCSKILLVDGEIEVCPRDQYGNEDRTACAAATIPCDIITVCHCPEDYPDPDCRETAEKTGYLYDASGNNNDVSQFPILDEDEELDEGYGAGGLLPFCFARTTAPLTPLILIPLIPEDESD